MYTVNVRLADDVFEKLQHEKDPMFVSDALKEYYASRSDKKLANAGRIIVIQKGNGTRAVVWAGLCALYKFKNPTLTYRTLEHDSKCMARVDGREALAVTLPGAKAFAMRNRARYGDADKLIAWFDQFRVPAAP